VAWHRIANQGELLTEGNLAVEIAGWQVLLVGSADDLFAYHDRCTHQAAQLSCGKVRRGAIMCPLHGARFKLDTGECIGGAYPALRRFAVRVDNGAIEVELPDEPPC
jgi:anthranilate 1,2-dioxygenase ferredoxin component